MSFWLWGKQKTPREILRENQRILRRSMRDIERERATLQRQEKTLTIEIKNMARKGQMSAARIMAKDLVRTRQHITKFYTLKSHLQGVSLRMQTLQSQQAMAEAMRGATKAMVMMNRQMNLPAMQRILQNFEIESEKMDMKQEMMADVMGDIFEEEGEEEATDEIINQVLDEIGINLSSELVDAPVSLGNSTKVQTPTMVTEGAVGTKPAGPKPGGGGGGGGPKNGGGGGGGTSVGGGGGSGAPPPSGGSTGNSIDDDLMARFDALKKN